MEITRIKEFESHLGPVEESTKQFYSGKISEAIEILKKTHKTEDTCLGFKIKVKDGRVVVKFPLKFKHKEVDLGPMT